MPAPDPEPELDMLEAFAEAVSTSSDTVVKDAEAVSACIDVVTDAEDVPPPLPHTEQQDNDAPMSWLASEQQIIDLTSIIEGSPMQLAVDLPPLTRVSDKSV